VSRASLDWNDATEVAIWLSGLRQSFDDLDGIALDMLKPARERELGHSLHEKHYADARASILHALDFASAPEPDDEEPDSGDPSGNGGAGPVH
jgi:hypothetical protein